MTPRFYLQILPLAALGVVGTAVGLQAGTAVESPATLAVALAVGLGCFIASRTFRDHAAWTAAFILGLSLAAGVVLADLGWEGGFEGAVGAIAILLVAALVGRALHRVLSVLYTPLWFAAWILILGLVGVSLTGGASSWRAPLAIVAGLVFAALSAAWFARLPSDPLPAAAMDLFLLGFNLYLILGVLQGSPV